MPKRVAGKKEHPLFKLQGMLSEAEAEQVRQAIREMREIDEKAWDEKIRRLKKR